jgi:hypothetical protein
MSAALLLAAASLGDTLRSWLEKPGGEAPRAQAYLDRFAGARAALPRGVRVGYLTDVPPERVWADGGAALLFHNAQNAVAPALLVNATDAEWLLGNFHEREALERAMKEGRYVVVHNARNGVVVLRRAAP